MLIAIFQKKIRLERNTYELRFYGFKSPSMGNRFMIAVHNVDKHFVFHMKLENETWVIISDAPSWVHEIQNKLSKIMIREMKKIGK